MNAMQAEGLAQLISAASIMGMSMALLALAAVLNKKKPEGYEPGVVFSILGFSLLQFFVHTNFQEGLPKYLDPAQCSDESRCPK